MALIAFPADAVLRAASGTLRALMYTHGNLLTLVEASLSKETVAQKALLCNNPHMEMVLDMKGLDKPCECGSGKLAGNCCRKDEPCPCGSEKKVSECCMKDGE